MGKLEIRAERKANGLCIYCGKNQPKNGRMGCEECLQNRHEDYLISRQMYLSMGICPICHKEKVAKYRTACPNCLAKAAEHQRKRTLRKKLARGT